MRTGSPTNLKIVCFHMLQKLYRACQHVYKNLDEMADVVSLLYILCRDLTGDE
jgi:hypothetical protein